MHDPSETYQELIEENSVLKQKIKELEQSIEKYKLTEEDLRESERKFAESFLKSPIPMAITSMKDGWYIDVNEALAKITGLEREELMRNNSVSAGYITAEQRALFLEEYREKGFVENLELQIRVKGGQLRHGLFNSSKITISGEAYFLTIVTDITDRKCLEEALQRSEERYRTIVENTTDAIYIHNFEGNIIDVNEDACRMTGYQREELVGANLIKIDPEWGLPVQKDLEQLLKDGTSIFERRNICKDGAKIPVEVSVKVISYDKKGIVAGFVRDISKRKQMEEELISYRNHLEELVQQRTAELEEKNLTLSELNTALKVLLQQRYGERKDLENKVVLNIQTYTLPYIEKLKACMPDGHQRVWLNIIEKNIAEIMSPMLTTVRQLNFTRQEIQVATLIREGKATKEIAELMGTSTKTVDTHRNHIRKKLGINKIKTNLYAYLQTVS